MEWRVQRVGKNGGTSNALVDVSHEAVRWFNSQMERQPG